MEDGYRSNINESELYPHCVFGSDIYDSMSIVTEISLIKTHETCDSSSFPSGFMLSLHMPDEPPKSISNFMYIPAEYEVFISVKPKMNHIMIATSDGLRKYAPEVRGCFFNSERPLGFFKSYSQQKFELECLANCTKNTCGCVHFCHQILIKFCLI